MPYVIHGRTHRCAPTMHVNNVTCAVIRGGSKPPPYNLFVQNGQPYNLLFILFKEECYGF